MHFRSPYADPSGDLAPVACLDPNPADDASVVIKRKDRAERQQAACDTRFNVVLHALRQQRFNGLADGDVPAAPTPGIISASRSSMSLTILLALKHEIKRVRASPTPYINPYPNPTKRWVRGVCAQ